MKKYYLFIALAMVAGMAVSCKNNKKAEADAEVVEAAKTILADDVLATLDELSQTYFDASGKFTIKDLISAEMTEEEKLVKPDYLLDPSEVNNLVTRAQKVNALAILVDERAVMEAYDMPLDESNEAIARLMAEVGTQFEVEDKDKMTISERIAAEYENCKENGDLPLFWQFQFSVVNETAYLISQNPELFLRNITEEQFEAFRGRFMSCCSAVKELAKYDTEIAAAVKAFDENRITDNHEVAMELYSSLASAKQTIIDSKDLIAARRAALLN